MRSNPPQAPATHSHRTPSQFPRFNTAKKATAAGRCRHRPDSAESGIGDHCASPVFSTKDAARRGWPRTPEFYAGRIHCSRFAKKSSLPPSRLVGSAVLMLGSSRLALLVFVCQSLEIVRFGQSLERAQSHHTRERTQSPCHREWFVCKQCGAPPRVGTTGTAVDADPYISRRSSCGCIAAPLPEVGVDSRVL
jgi:hypothetical protein